MAASLSRLSKSSESPPSTTHLGLPPHNTHRTIKLWRGTECAATLEGHDGPVLSLAVAPGGDLISGSGDATARRWAGGRCVQVYKGHTDTVRALCALPGVGFVSGSHDATLRVWALSGETLAELVGHTALVYAVAAAQDGSLIVSGALRSF